MAEFIYSKGYLTSNTLSWDVNEFLQGSNVVNDCAIEYRDEDAANEVLVGAFATDSDVVFVGLTDASGSTYDNELLGYCTLSGGFSSVCMFGSFAFMVSKSDQTLVYYLDLADCVGGDNTANMALYFTAADDVSSLGGDVVSSVGYLYYATGGNAAQNKIHIRNTSTSDDYSSSIGVGTDAPRILKGHNDASGTLYFSYGGLVHTVYDAPSISANGWFADVSYGYVGDDFAGVEIDDLKWYTKDDGGNMVSCFTQNDELVINTNSAAGASYAYQIYFAYMAGNIGIQTRFEADTWPVVGAGENVYVALELTSIDFQTQYRIIRGRKPVVAPATNEHYLRFEIVKAGSVTYSSEVYNPGDDCHIRVERRDPVTTGKTIYWLKEQSWGGGIWDTFSEDDTSGSDIPLLARIYVYNDTGSAFQGTCSAFTADTDSSVTNACYTDLADDDIIAGGISPILTDDERVVSLVYEGGEVQYFRTDETSAGGGTSEDTAVPSSDASSLINSSSPVATAVTYDGDSCLFGGESGFTQIDCSTSTPLLLRDYDTTYDHSQPITGPDVLCLDCLSDAGGIVVGQDDTYTSNGGGGWIVPDFTAADGSDPWSSARNSDEITSGADHPNPIPTDYLHAHLERRIDAGSWYRLKDNDVWTLYNESGWDNDTDYEWESNDTLIYHEEDLSDGIYEYRWIYHDEAGNVGTQACVTAYGDNSSYLDTPVISALTLNSAVDPSTSTGISVSFTLHSGTSTSSTADRVYQVKIWNNSESEANAPWQDYSSGDTYTHVLANSNGIQTVYARARHTSGEESSIASQTITLAVPTAAATPVYDHENMIICYGEDADYNFTSDNASLTAYNSESEVSKFPMENVQNYDLGSVWRTDGLGEATLETGYFQYEWGIKFDLGSAKVIDVVSILGHNLGDTYNNVSGMYDLTLWLYQSTNAIAWTPIVDLAASINQDEIVHRNPYPTARQYWMILCRFKVPTSSTAPVGTAWEIGRIILNESALCFQPSSNFERDSDLRWKDPSVVEFTDSDARRVVERNPYRTASYPFMYLSEADKKSMQTIWRRQRSIRPVLILKDPHNIKESTETPDGTEEYTAIYGWLDDTMTVQDEVNERADIAIEVIEARSGD